MSSTTPNTRPYIKPVPPPPAKTRRTQLAEQLNAIEDKIDEVHERLVRTETRLVLLMRADGLDANGKYID